ncbi:hemerythrin domain-containing protein [Sporomusa sp.]|uniref:hemerythrin domain-containing protein n=1 Tax=Sporomusa sp. TaxID=2078658 RepID=UPI002CA401EE|nr:hemerythrin domain-containing protein [Sporomusa sp.]HWR44896.1 hemerythrin domain-containing protein [Sporomusa sp.]
MQLEQRGDMIADLIQRYNAGLGIEQTNKEARAVFAHMNPDELIQLEEYLSSKHIDIKDFHDLYQIHREDLHTELSRFRLSLDPEHPLRVMLEEHEQILQTLDALDKLNTTIQSSSTPDREVLVRLREVADNLLAAEHHHAREEEVIFPELTKNNIGGIVQVMNMEHEELREKKRELKELVSQALLLDFTEFQQELQELAKFIIYNLTDHIYKENHILYPAAMRFVKDKELWNQLKEKCDEIGYCNFKTLQ